MTYSEDRLKALEYKKDTRFGCLPSLLSGILILPIVPLIVFGLFLLAERNFLNGLICIASAIAIYLFLRKFHEKEDELDNTIKYHREQSSEGRTIINNLKSKFELYFSEIENEELFLEYDRIEKQKNEKFSYSCRIESEYFKEIQKLESEIEHYGDTIDHNDYEYTSRMDRIRKMKKEIKTVELELDELREVLHKKEQEIRNNIKPE